MTPLSAPPTARGASRTDLATVIGVTLEEVTAWEMGKAELTVSRLRALTPHLESAGCLIDLVPGEPPAPGERTAEVFSTRRLTAGRYGLGKSGPLGAIVPAGGIVGCEASSVFLARTREAGGERRGGRAPAFRVVAARAHGPEPNSKPTAATRASSTIRFERRRVIDVRKRFILRNGHAQERAERLPPLLDVKDQQPIRGNRLAHRVIVPSKDGLAMRAIGEIGR